MTGDTKVVDCGRGHGVFINTSGIGVLEHKLTICSGSIQPGDVIILNGDIGRHGIAVMAEREGLAFETEIESDCAPVADPVLRMIAAGVEVHCLRDLTRGGLATALVEMAEASRLHIEIDESAIPVSNDVQGACEVLGFDPLYVANEGRFVAFVPERYAEKTLAILGCDSFALDARIIGKVTDQNSGLVTMKSMIGAERIYSGYVERRSAAQNMLSPPCCQE